MKWFFVALLLLYGGASAWAQGQAPANTPAIFLTTASHMEHHHGYRVAIKVLIWANGPAVNIPVARVSADMYRDVVLELESREFQRTTPFSPKTGNRGPWLVTCEIMIGELHRYSSQVLVAGSIVVCGSQKPDQFVPNRLGAREVVLAEFDRRLQQELEAKFPQP